MSTEIITDAPIEAASPASRTVSPTREPRGSLGFGESSSRSGSKSRIGQAVSNVFSSHASPQDLSFADDRGLERQAREAERSASRSASRAASREPRGALGFGESSSRSGSKSRIGQAVSAVFSSHAPPQDLSFADDRGLERQAREAETSTSRSNSQAREPRGSLGMGESTNRSESKSRLAAAVKSVFSSHASPQDLSFADDKGLERQSREASRSRNASREASRSRGASKVRGGSVARGVDPVLK